MIDESDSYQPSGDYRRSNDYPDNGLDDDEQFDNKPINLSKAVESKRDDQVCKLSAKTTPMTSDGWHAILHLNIKPYSCATDVDQFVQKINSQA